MLGKVKLLKSGKKVTIALTCSTGTGVCAGWLELWHGTKRLGKISYALKRGAQRTLTLKVANKLKPRTKVTLKSFPAGAQAFSRSLNL